MHFRERFVNAKENSIKSCQMHVQNHTIEITQLNHRQFYFHFKIEKKENLNHRFRGHPLTENDFTSQAN